MRKKLLAVLLALCMAIGLVSTALAAELTQAQKDELKAKGYTDAQIEELNKSIADIDGDEVVLIFEDTTITEAESRLVVVVNPSVTVTVEGANVSTGIVVAPGAAESKVLLNAGAKANAVVVLDKAEVTVAKDAQANFVIVAAPAAAVTVAGTASSVTVAEAAKGASVSVAAEATVSSVTVAAPEAKANIAGTVSSVSVAETAEGASTTVSGTVSNMAVNAPNTTTTVPEGGSVGTVNVGDKATGTTINADSADAVGKVTGNTDNATGSGVTEDNTKKDEVVADTHMAAPKIVAAPLGDKSKGNIVYAPGYSVSVSANGSNSKKFDVVIAGKIPQHDSSQDKGNSSFVGIAIPIPVKVDTAEEGAKTVTKTVEYKYYIIKTNADTGKVAEIQAKEPTGKADVTGAEMKSQGILDANLDCFYDTFYYQDRGSLAPLTSEESSPLKKGTVELVAVDASKTEEIKAIDVDGKTETSEEELAAKKDAIYNAAEFILNVVNKAEDAEAEIIKVTTTSGDKGAEPTVSLEVAESASPTPTEDVKFVTAPSGTLTDDTTNKVKQDIVDTSKDSTPSDPPTYETAIPAPPTAGNPTVGGAGSEK